MFSELGGIGRDEAGGFTRTSWSAADAELRAWFAQEAAARDMAFEQDGNGNLWAWWGGPGDGAVVTGSHLDSVPNGGAFDGPLGVVSAFLAVDHLRAQSLVLRHPLAVACFSDEEGAGFGVACVGSRLMTGTLSPDAARRLVGPQGATLEEAMRRAGADPAGLGPTPERVAAIDAYVELHIEQGRRLVDIGAPLGLATAIWPHGRWRCSFRGEPDHAGTTLLEDRHDPVLAFSVTALAARRAAQRYDARATFGKVVAHPNATNAVAGRVDAWLDCRAEAEATLKTAVAEIVEAAEAAAADFGCGFEASAESLTPRVEFDPKLRQRISAVLGGVPELATAAGHDAGVLSGCVKAAMLFVRNPTGTSHSPAEHADVGDCLAGVHALAQVLADLACR